MDDHKNKMDITLSRGTLSKSVIAILLVLQAAMAAALAITPGSFWVDEFGTAKIANVGSLVDWWSQYSTWPDADIQMPFYHFYMYVWSSIFGYAEYAMRMANLPLFIIAEAFLIYTFRRMPRFAVILLLFTSFHPMVWYYLNEARPYMMVYMSASITFCGLVHMHISARKGGKIDAYQSWLLGGGMLLLAGSNMLGALWVIGAVVLASYLHIPILRAGRRLHPSSYWAYSLLSLGLVTLASYYAYTLLHGARATAYYESNLLTALFSGYELLGLSGLGPGRLELRSIGIDALRGWLLPITIGATVLAICIAFGIRAAFRILGRCDFQTVALVILAPALLILAVGYFLHWRVLGRHFMTMLPLVLAVMSLGVTSLFQARRFWSSALAIIGTSTIIFSGQSMRLPHHGKDDYASAASMSAGLLSTGYTVWWAASANGAGYYQLPIQGVTRRSDDGCRSIPNPPRVAVIYVSNPKRHCLDQLPKPDVIVFSKPDAYDQHGALVNWIEASAYQQTDEFRAFHIWREVPNAN